MRVMKNIMVPMNDGVKLATDIYTPENMTTGPVLIARTPYNKDFMDEHVMKFAEHGYIVIVQDVRGRYSSEGKFNPHAHEKEDGLTNIQWINAQKWCNGHIGTFGASYLGGTQWLTAVNNPEGLDAMITEVTFDDTYEGMTYQSGAKILHDLRWAAASIIPDAVRRAEEETGIKETRPLPDVDTVLEALPMAAHPMMDDYGLFYKEWLANNTQGDYWKKTAPNQGYDNVHVPVLNISGWYDIFVPSTLRNYMGMKKEGPTEEVRNNQYLIMGPWTHMNFTGVFPEIDYGEQASSLNMGLMDIKLRWYDKWMKGLDVVPMPTHVKVFVMGANRWQDEEDWPIPRTEYKPYYIDSKGKANSSSGDGRLSTTEPVSSNNEHVDTYTYDPLEPTPTVGGQVILPGENAMGPRDQQEMEKRSDVLVYTTEPLDKDVEVIGPVTMHLYASTKTLDTDFTAKLVDVNPDGRAFLLTDGIVRGRFREGTDEEVLLTPDTVYEFVIDMGATANLFKKGHQIRLEIASANFPKFNRNSNTGGDIPNEKAEEYRTTINSVYHSKLYPSKLILPITN